MRIALFGSGWAMPFHARAVQEHPAAGLVAAASWREGSLARMAAEFGIPRITTRWEDLAEDPGVDAALIGTPNASHASGRGVPAGGEARAGGKAHGGGPRGC
jgi:predicted dehydrogenase